MSEEIYMGIKFPDSLTDIVKKIIDEHVEDDWGVTQSGIRELHYGWFYIDVHELTHELAELGIPCTISWEREYKNEQVNYIHVRFTEDEVKITDVYEEDFYLPLTAIKSKLELSSHAEVTVWVDQMIQSTKEPSWDNQEELGKQYAFIKSLEK